MLVREGVLEDAQELESFVVPPDGLPPRWPVYSVGHLPCAGVWLGLGKAGQRCFKPPQGLAPRAVPTVNRLQQPHFVPLSRRDVAGHRGLVLLRLRSRVKGLGV